MLSWFKLNKAPIFPLLKHPKFLLLAVVIALAGCSLEKESGFNRTMQNLTAHYNILFNAKELLRLKQISYATSFVDNYNEILSVYQDTTAQSTVPDKDLEAVIAKANKIISIKEQSHYLGDAYLLLGKAYFLEGNYFNASEYFDYVVRSYPQRMDLVQDALTWKARSAMYLNHLPEAKMALDTAVKNINPKKRPPADIFATRLQYDINIQNYAEAEDAAKVAVQNADNKIQRLRWRFILAQIQEHNNETAAAFANYTKIANSNAVFEMAFNASLNRIRIEEKQKGIKLTRQQRLLALLKDPNNKEFKDQIYYQVAELYMVNKDINNAIKNYNLSIRNSVRNQNQKGLSYLRLAQINFKIKANYINAKKYYDSTLTSLSANYPGYQVIKKTSDNLQLLADRSQIIIREDTLQALAKMDETTRLKTIDKMVSDRILQQQAAINSANANTASSNDGALSSGAVSSFYFYNANAVSQGYTDFKKKWGNRKLEDNWRRSSRDNSDITNSQATNLQGGDPDAPPATGTTGKSASTAGNYRQDLLQGLPLTPTQLAQSNLRIYNAYIDIADFYRDILRDTTEAIAMYETILKRFPNDYNKAPIYYSLYRLYMDKDVAKSDEYKNKILKDYAGTPFAKIIIDPDFARKLDDKDAEFTRAYNQVFDLYVNKEYKDVIGCSFELMKQYPNNKYAAQLYYLKTLAEGHNEKVNPFRDSLQEIVTKYPNDKLITPLVYQHLAYMSANNAEIMNRKTVLADEDPQDIPFTLDNALKEKTAYRHPVIPGYIVPKPEEKRQQPVLAQTTQPARVQTANTAVPDKLVKNTSLSIFTKNDSTNYFFIVNVNSGTTNLSSSRFGIGQFNRVNFAGRGIKHLVIPIGTDNQLIYVGRFPSLDAVKKYAQYIIPILPDIMKVPKDKYTFFIITQENLNKLADKKTLDSYVDYYQTNY
ncbi:tetratricopeptide repeat protein [Mucilaginibacter frigoritolerans]|uniref:Tetratricopeptide repeat protein n=1 Tax=Mucilaginibacter frigoritolerans TaxID=652788 RepID=A0A562U3T3_9SPHI|nr:tetratricopeptide repeat protein [Mucilaginibacter frigoritolerans]TWJ00035.1 tetratricopeptide repeat protein [Mucilaginibacter frigoritolerans]